MRSSPTDGARPASRRPAVTALALFPGPGPKMTLDEHRGLGLADAAIRDTGYQILDLLGDGVEAPRVQTEKDQQDHEPHPLVPVQERVIPHDVKEMGRRHLVEALVQESPVKSGGGGAQCGLQETEVPDPRPPSVPRSRESDSCGTSTARENRRRGPCSRSRRPVP